MTNPILVAHEALLAGNPAAALAALEPLVAAIHQQEAAAADAAERRANEAREQAEREEQARAEREVRAARAEAAFSGVRLVRVARGIYQIDAHDPAYRWTVVRGTASDVGLPGCVDTMSTYLFDADGEYRGIVPPARNRDFAEAVLRRAQRAAERSSGIGYAGRRLPDRYAAAIAAFNSAAAK